MSPKSELRLRVVIRVAIRNAIIVAILSCCYIPVTAIPMGAMPVSIRPVTSPVLSDYDDIVFEYDNYANRKEKKDSAN